MFQFQFCIDVGFCMLRFYDVFFSFSCSFSVLLLLFFCYCVDINYIFTLSNLPLKRYLQFQQKTNLAVFSFWENDFI